MSLADLHIEMELGSPESNSCLVARGLGLSSLACASVCEELLLDRASVISLAPLAERFVLFSASEGKTADKRRGGADEVRSTTIVSQPFDTATA